MKQSGTVVSTVNMQQTVETTVPRLIKKVFIFDVDSTRDAHSLFCPEKPGFQERKDR